MDKIIIRHETTADFTIVENLTREAFWNLYVPGCDEHYLVHKMRSHPDFIPELAFVALVNQQIAGSILFTKSYIETADKQKIGTLTFGPLCVHPSMQHTGIGTELIRHAKKAALSMEHRAMIILGSPYNYVKHGFRSCRDFNITDAAGEYPLGLLVCELQEGVLKGVSGRFFYSGVYHINPEEAEKFDLGFNPKAKEHRPSQELFSMLIRAYLK